jgi:subtilisin family serine protease
MSSSFKAYVDKLYFEQDIVIVAGKPEMYIILCQFTDANAAKKSVSRNVAAAGNDGKKGLKYPAAHSTVVAVGALSSDYSLWGGSNWGSGLEVVAPGNLVLSTAFNGNGDYVYQLWSGTSMATPHVAGVAVS